MTRNVTRRDFLNGAALALAAGATLSPRELLALQEGAAPSLNGIGKHHYPPALTGMRGSHDGSYEVAHALAWRGELPADYTLLDERYDLVVVGAGLSGLASAYLYRQQAGADKKILILDNHDDFGGHARRNEFHADGRMLLGAGGSLNLEVGNFSDRVHRVLKELGVDLEKLEAACEPGYFISEPGAGMSYYLNAEQYGQHRIVQGAWFDAWLGGGDYRALLESLDLPGDQGQRLLALVEGESDLLDELSLSESKRYMDSTSYQEFLSSRAGLAPATVALFDPMLRLFYGVGTDSVSVTEAVMMGAPGLKSLGLTATLLSNLFAMAGDAVRYPMFPDGNASVARLLVRKLIPGVAQYFCPGSFFEAVTQAPPVSLGAYRAGSEGSEPMVLWMAHMPAPRNNGSQNMRDLYRLGQHRLYTTPFATYEAEIGKQLTGMLGARGFDADRDIEAITVNRWSHGYAYEYAGLYDPGWEAGQAPHELGRKPLGRISIANSDAEGSAYLHAAIDAAGRAVGELSALHR